MRRSPLTNSPAERTPLELGQFRRLLAFVGAYRLQLAVGMVATLISAALGLVFPQYVGAFFDTFVAGGTGQLDRVVLILLGIFLVQAVFNFLRSYLLALAGEGVVADLRTALYRHLLTLPVRAQALEALGHGDEAQRALAEAELFASQQDNALAVHRIGLERDRLQGNLESASKRLAWFEERGLKNGVNLARRYFPELAQASLSPATAPSDTLRFEVLGPLRVVQGGKDEPVRGHKRREFLLRLLEARIVGRAEVPQLELIDMLYPGEPEDSATVPLRQLVFQVRSQLGPAVIVRTGGGYALGDVGSDVEDFLTTGNTKLWRGLYREDIDGQGDEAVASALYHALKLKTDELLASDPHEAARLGQRLLRADPYDLAELRLTLKALQASGQRQTLEKLYQQERRQFGEVGEVLPESWTSFLAASPA